VVLVVELKEKDLVFVEGVEILGQPLVGFTGAEVALFLEPLACFAREGESPVGCRQTHSEPVKIDANEVSVTHESLVTLGASSPKKNL